MNAVNVGVGMQMCAVIFNQFWVKRGPLHSFPLGFRFAFHFVSLQMKQPAQTASACHIHHDTIRKREIRWIIAVSCALSLASCGRYWWRSSG
jgi:hypothetical protein